MIRRLSVKNLRVLEDVTIDLAPWTVLVGPNGCGKSSVLEGIDLATHIYEIAAKVFSGPRDARFLRRQGHEGPIALEIEGTWDGKTGRLRLEIESGEMGEPEVQRSGEWGGKAFSTTIPESMRRVVKSAVLLRLQARRLAEPSYTDEPTPRLESDGSGLASVLADMQLRTPERLKELSAMLQSIVPSVASVRVGRAMALRPARPHRSAMMGAEESSARTRTVQRRYEEVMGFELLLDVGGAKEVPAHQLSEGTLLTLGLLTVILGPTQPRLILVDDIDRALHPAALGSLAGQIRKLIEQVPDLQVVATSHSPYLADHLKPEELIVGALDESGAARFARLSDHPELGKWRDLMGMGEFWSTVGEGWLTERRTSADTPGDGSE